eukprot:1349793-Rhodomonas_salina.8
MPAICLRAVRCPALRYALSVCLVPAQRHATSVCLSASSVCLSVSHARSVSLRHATSICLSHTSTLTLPLSRSPALRHHANHLSVCLSHTSTLPIGERIPYLEAARASLVEAKARETDPSSRK